MSLNRIENEMAPPASVQGWQAGLAQKPPLGSHLATSRFGYTHHGIYVGGGKVVHYAGLCRSWHPGPVEEVTISQFAFGHPVWIVDHPESIYSAEEIVRRARLRVGEHDYRLLTNNCEHFCNWCVSGFSRSAQIERPSEFPAIAIVLAARLVARLPRRHQAQRTPAMHAVYTS
jgi:Lecithin retinol acyltransferase